MKTKLALVGLLACTTQAYAADDMLSGIPKLACEAILCLSTGSPPGECTPSLTHYFNIDFDDFSDTIKERLNFLRQCPVADSEPRMTALVTAIANGAGRCDAASLNATLIGYPNGFMGGGCVASQKPAYCSAYETHEYTRLGTTVYVQDPPRTTFWPFQSVDIGGFGQGSFMGGIGSTTTQSCGHWVNRPPAP